VNFDKEVTQRIASNADDAALKKAAGDFMLASVNAKYSYNFSWLGRPIIQYPQDIIAMQEILWRVKPQLVVETGIARGGSLIFFAAMLELNAACGGPADARVVGVDIDIRYHNRDAIEAHPLFKRIDLIEGASTATEIFARVRNAARGRAPVLVSLDSNHTHAHVLEELELYAPLVSIGSYCVVFDTIIEHMPKACYPDRPWGPGDNPKSALTAYLRAHPEFEVDRRVDDQLVISVSPGGYLKRVR
jgi:cephalosporin hydroxylase